MFQIETGYEIPKRRVTTESEYPFDHMEVGDSFLYPAQEGDELTKLATRVRAAVGNYRKREGNAEKKFTVRIVDYGVRCWRI